MLEIKNKIEFENNLWAGLINSSTFNSSKEDRINAVTDIASITKGKLGFDNKIVIHKAKSSDNIEIEQLDNNNEFHSNLIKGGRLKLYNRLLTESAGKPSTPFEFIPVKIEYSQLIKLIRTANNIHDLSRLVLFMTNKVIKYSYLVENNGLFILTNLRCLLNVNIKEEDIPFNTPEEIEGFKVVVARISKTAFDHLVTHGEVRRIAESSRNKKYFNEVKFHYPINNTGLRQQLDDIETLKRLSRYIENGMKAEDATKELSCRRLMLCAFHGWLQNENSWQNLFNLRINPNAQSITQQVVTNIKQVIK